MHIAFVCLNNMHNTTSYTTLVSNYYVHDNAHWHTKFSPQKCCNSRRCSPKFWIHTTQNISIKFKSSVEQLSCINQQSRIAWPVLQSIYFQRFSFEDSSKFIIKKNPNHFLSAVLKFIFFYGRLIAANSLGLLKYGFSFFVRLSRILMRVKTSRRQWNINHNSAKNTKLKIFRIDFRLVDFKSHYYGVLRVWVLCVYGKVEYKFIVSTHKNCSGGFSEK